MFSLILLGAGTALGATVYKYVAVQNTAILTDNYFDDQGYKVFRFQDSTRTCYTLEYKTSDNRTDMRSVSISCTR